MDHVSESEDFIPESTQDALSGQDITHHHYFKVVATGQGAIRYCKYCGEAHLLGHVYSHLVWKPIAESE